MTAREDNNFLESLRALEVRGATPRVAGTATARVITLTGEDVRKVRWAASRRRQGLPSQIRDATLLGRVVGLIRTR